MVKVQFRGRMSTTVISRLDQKPQGLRVGVQGQPNTREPSEEACQETHLPAARAGPRQLGSRPRA